MLYNRGKGMLERRFFLHLLLRPISFRTSMKDGSLFETFYSKAYSFTMRSEISSSIIICGLVLLASCSSTSFVVIWFSLSCRFHLIWLDNTLREVSLFVIALASGILIVRSAVLYFFVRSGTFLNILGFDFWKGQK